MRHFRWAILVGQLILVALALAVPRIDVPQTAFNEADTPVNQATVIAVLSCRTALAGLRASASVATVVIQSRQTYPATVDGFIPRQHARSHSLLALLCAFLC